MLVTDDFWTALDELARESRLVIDRPRGSFHPRYPDLIYPLDYGYLDGTTAGDGYGIDAWRGSLQPPGLVAVAVSIDLSKRDAEIKLLLGCTEAEKESILTFLNGAGQPGWQKAILIDRLSPTIAQDELITNAELWMRRSIRRFSSQPVSDLILQQILQAAHRAPSAHNRQPWRFVMISSKTARETLADALAAAFQRDLCADGVAPDRAAEQAQRSYQRICEAPAAILVCLQTSGEDSYPDKRRQLCEHLMGVQSVAMAGENLLIAAAGQGLGGVWMCAPLFAPQVACRALDLPASWDPQGLVLLGYPTENALEQVQRSRLAIEEVILWL